MKNAKVAAHLLLISQLETVAKAGHFKIVAFKNAADAVTALPTPVEDADLDSLKDVGKSVAAVIRDFLARGTSSRLEQLEKEVCPASVMTMTHVRMIGPKTALKLWQDLGVSSLDELIAAVPSGKVPEKHLKAIEEAAKNRTRERVPRDVAKMVASWAWFQLEPHTKSMTICGSVRRQTPDSKDIDLVACVDPEKKAALLREFADLGDLLESGPEKMGCMVERYGVRMQVDLWLAEPWRYGATVLYATGSKQHNIAMRALAQARGQTLNEKGLYLAEAKEFTQFNQICGATEEDVYRALRIRYVSPHERVGDELIPA
jgi:DNA polymerase (family 10)